MAPSPKDTGRIDTVTEIFVKNWIGFVAFIVPFLFDTFIGFAIFSAFLWFSWVLGWARVSGLASQDSLDAYENLHTWLNLGLYSMMGVGFLWRVIRRVFRGE